MNQSLELLPKSLEVIPIKENELSLYRGALNTSVVIQNIAKIRKSFPSLPEGFYDILSDRIKANNFTDERLNDAVENVIDTCIYPTPTIAQFISWDKRIKYYKYPDIVQKVDDGDPNAFDRYKRVELPELPEAVWIHINDIAKYNIKQ